jgi:hypothetical protein
MKTCSTCKQAKELTDFHKRTASKDGLRATCKTCVSKQRRHRPNSNEYKTKIKRVYGIDLNEYHRMLLEQNGECKICGVTEPGLGRDYFCIDHCHTTGKVRGLLCNSCNVGIARFKDNCELLKNAINYLSTSAY